MEETRSTLVRSAYTAETFFLSIPGWTVAWGDRRLVHDPQDNRLAGIDHSAKSSQFGHGRRMNAEFSWLREFISTD